MEGRLECSSGRWRQTQVRKNGFQVGREERRDTRIVLERSHLRSLHHLDAVSAGGGGQFVHGPEYEYASWYELHLNTSLLLRPQ